MWFIPRKVTVVGLFLGLVMATILWPGPVMAHKVYLFAWVEGDQVMVDAYFSKSRKVKQGRIQVLDPDGRVLLEGVTDDQGAFSFDIPQKTDLTLVLDASMGHRTEFVITADELPDSAPAASVQAKAPATPTPAVPVAAPGAVAGRVNEPAPLDTGQLREVVEAALDNRMKTLQESLHGLQRSVARLQEDKGPGMTEIFGGIGWIVGLFGVAAYFRGRSIRRNGG